MKSEVSAAVFAAAPSQLLKPITTSKGVHLILLEEINQLEINNSLRNKIMLDLFSEWLKQQIEKNDIICNFD